MMHEKVMARGQADTDAPGNRQSSPDLRGKTSRGRKKVSKEYCLTQEHINFLASEKTLMAWITKSIKERCIFFHRSYPDKFIKPWRLRAIYKANLIKKKVIRTTKMP